ncbi:hypothetical protein KQI63_13340 [bacterium]|nr:hypothetical protein [bacterium]
MHGQDARATPSGLRYAKDLTERCVIPGLTRDQASFVSQSFLGLTPDRVRGDTH